MNYYDIPFVLVATKADKLSKAAAQNALRVVAKGFNVASDEVLLVSSLTVTGRDRVLAAISDRI